MTTFAKSLMAYYSSLRAPKNLPKGVEIMNPYQEHETFKIASAFYHKYYNDNHERIACFGINPGRFGAGITGVPFTDPVRLQQICGIENHFDKKSELSSKFIYEMIMSYGGAKAFYGKYYISAVSPLGYVSEGINLNYYDIKGFKERFETYAVREIKKQKEIGISPKVAFSIGKGQNFNYLKYLNKKHELFDNVVALPHPRWVMQYRLKQKEQFIESYLKTLEENA